MAQHGLAEKKEAEFYAECVKLFLDHQKKWRPLEARMREASAKIPLMVWQARWSLFSMKCKWIWFKCIHNTFFYKIKFTLFGKPKDLDPRIHELLSTDVNDIAPESKKSPDNNKNTRQSEERRDP